MSKPYWGLTALLLLSFIAFAFTPSFRQTMLENDAPAPAPVHQADSTSEELPQIRQTDTSSKKILMIGDSMLESFGPRLSAYSLKNGHTLTYVIWYSSTTVNWGGTDKLAGYIREYKPDYIFICLGGNELFVRDIATKRQKYVDRMLSDIGDIPYVWIGPPNWKEDTGINDMLQASCKEGTFYLSKNDKFERNKDGVHPTKASGAQWCDNVCKWIMQESAYPIKLEAPEKNAKGKCKVLVLKPSE